MNRYEITGFTKKGIKNVLAFGRTHTKSELMVYLVLWDYATCKAIFPSEKVMATKAGCTDRQVRRALKTLRDEKIVKFKKVSNGRSKWAHNEYEMVVDDDPEIPDTDVRKIPDTDVRLVSSSIQGVAAALPCSAKQGNRESQEAGLPAVSLNRDRGGPVETRAAVSPVKNTVAATQPLTLEQIEDGIIALWRLKGIKCLDHEDQVRCISADLPVAAQQLKVSTDEMMLIVKAAIDNAADFLSRSHSIHGPAWLFRKRRGSASYNFYECVAGHYGHKENRWANLWRIIKQRRKDQVVVNA